MDVSLMNKAAGLQPQPSKQGTTLVEVLVTIVIFSFVMLGVASAELVSISSARDANMRSIATFSAESLAAILRSNTRYWKSLDEDFNLKIETVIDGTSGAASSAYSSTQALGDYNLDLADGGCDLDAGGCAPEEIAVTDIKRWSDNWVASATNAGATIENIAAAGESPLFRITLSWRQKQRAVTGDSEDASGNLINQYQTLVKL